MPALVKRSVGSSAGIRGDDGTRRCPRSSKKLRKRSRTSPDFIIRPETFDHLRNPLRREAPAGERIDRAAAPRTRRKRREPFPRPFERAGERSLFGFPIPRGERGVDDVPREASGRELALDPPRSVSGRAQSHRRLRRPELVEPAFLREAVERAGNRPALEAAVGERSGELFAAAG